MIGLYSIFFRGLLCVRIPKKKAQGYLKSCFGGHHVNEESRRFSSLCPYRDIVDIDGYTTIQCNREDVQEVLGALVRVFPRITEWKEVNFETISSQSL